MECPICHFQLELEHVQHLVLKSNTELPETLQNSFMSGWLAKTLQRNYCLERFDAQLLDVGSATCQNLILKTFWFQLVCHGWQYFMFLQPLCNEIHIWINRKYIIANHVIAVIEPAVYIVQASTLQFICPCFVSDKMYSFVLS